MMFAVAVLMLSLLSGPQLQAQATSNAAAVTMTFAVNSSMTVAATPGSIVFTPTDAKNATASAAIAIVTSWNLAVGGGKGFTGAYFQTFPAPLRNPPRN